MSLDPKSNRFEREAAQAEADIPPPLDPPFPFQPTEFDPWFFQLEVEPSNAGGQRSVNSNS